MITRTNFIIVQAIKAYQAMAEYIYVHFVHRPISKWK